jgi:hypothetical protein
MITVTCPNCYANTEVSRSDRDCNECGEYVGDGAIEPLEPTVTRREP